MHNACEELDIDLHHVAASRKNGVPMEYILRQALFMEYTFDCCPDTLIPVEETSLLVHTALDLIAHFQDGSKPPLTIVDVGTGCGNVAICLARKSVNTTILASDLSAGAVEIATRNVSRHDLSERVSVFCGDLLAPIREMGYAGKIDMVVCNPPYIPTGSLNQLAPEIIDHEPLLALDAGPYGIDFFRRLISEAGPILKPGGVLVFEIGAGQEKLVARLLSRSSELKLFGQHSIGNQIRVISAVRKAAS